MKKLLQKINTRETRSLIFGLVLALAIGGASSFVSAQGSISTGGGTAAVPFLGPTTGLLSRIGSLTVGASTTASWITSTLSEIGCTRSTYNGVNTCLDVSGGGTFANLIIDQTTQVRETAVVSSLGEYGGGLGDLGIIPTFLIEDIGAANNSMLVQGLGRVSGSEGSEGQQNFNPLNTTNERDICARPSGELRIC